MVTRTDDGVTEPIRVLHVIDHLWGGGAEASLVAYLEAVADDPRVESVVVCLAGDMKSREIAANLPAHVVTGRQRRRLGPADVLLIRRAIRQHRPSIIHSSLIRSDVAVGLATTGRPHLVTVTGPLVVEEASEVRLDALRRLARRTIRRVWEVVIRRPHVHVHAVSRSTRDALVGSRLVSRDRIHVVHRGRPTLSQQQHVHVERTRESLSLPSDATVVLMIAREVPSKNHELLLHAAATLKNAAPSFVFLLAGEHGSATPVIDDLVEELGLNDVVRRLGHRASVADLLAIADVVVSTSRAEGSPGAILEAMAMGKPILAVSAPGVDEVLGPDYPGIVNSSRPEDLSNRLLVLRSDHELLARLAQSGLQRHRDHYSMSRYVMGLHAVYRMATTTPA